MKTQSKMAVQVTLVFSDEAHREAWLVANEFVARRSEYSNRPDEYDRRHQSQNLTFVVGRISADPCRIGIDEP